MNRTKMLDCQASVLAGGFLFVAVPAATLLGCGQPPTFSDLEPLINTSCALSSCHGISRQGMMSLLPADAYCALVGPKDGATYRSTAIAQYPRRVVPGSRQESFVYIKLTLPPGQSGDTQPLGSVMPQDMPFQDPSNIELFGKWIDGGAKDANGQPAPSSCP